MTPLEWVDEWLHRLRMRWLSRILGICAEMDRRLDELEKDDTSDR